MVNWESIWNEILQAVNQDIVIRIIVGGLMIIMLIGLSLWKQIDMEKMFLASFARGFIQILLMGSILVFIFQLEKIWLLYVVLLFMCAFASFTMSRRYNYPNILVIEFVAIFVGTMFIMTVTIFTGIIGDSHRVLLEIGKVRILAIPIENAGEFVIPMGSMVVSNTMVITGITLERIKSDVIKSQGKIEAALALGSTKQKAIESIVQDSLRAGLKPTTNRLAVLGVVNIPGLMSGMIIGGVNPVIAAVYQVLIYAMILSSAIIGSIIVTYLFPRVFLNENDQLELKAIQELNEKNETNST